MRRNWFVNLGLFSCFLLVFLAFPLKGQATVVSSTSDPAISFENLTEEVGRGFGSTWNRYAFSMTEYNNDIYVGTWNLQIDYPQLIAAAQSGQLAEDLALLAGGGNALKGIKYIASTGAEIWRHDGGQTWKQVHKAASENTGFRKMVEYDGMLYAGSANSTTGTKLYSSTDGENWTLAKDFGPDNNSIRTMVVHDGKLYLGTENNETGGELWSFDGSWKTGPDMVFSEDSSVAELAIYKGKMHVGTWDFSDGYNLYRKQNGGFDKVTPEFSGSDSLNNLGVMKLIEFNGELYLGTVNYADGFTLLKTSNTSDKNGWDVISTDGLGNMDNAYTWSMVVWDNTLYIGTFNSGIRGGELDPLPVPLDGRAQLWSSKDGTNWTPVFEDGLDSKFTYGIRNMLVAGDKLYLGTASNFFIPDLLSELYNLEGFDFDSFALTALRKLDPSLIAQIEGLVNSYDLYSERPFIGTQIWASTAPVPEPSTLILIGIGLLGLCFYRRKSPRPDMSTETE